MIGVIEVAFWNFGDEGSEFFLTEVQRCEEILFLENCVAEFDKNVFVSVEVDFEDVEVETADIAEEILVLNSHFPYIILLFFFEFFFLVLVFLFYETDGPE